MTDKDSVAGELPPEPEDMGFPPDDSDNAGDVPPDSASTSGTPAYPGLMLTETRPDELLPDNPRLGLLDYIRQRPVAPPATVEATHAQVADAVAAVLGARVVSRPAEKDWLGWEATQWATKTDSDVHAVVKGLICRRTGQPRRIIPYSMRKITTADAKALIDRGEAVASPVDGLPLHPETQRPITHLPYPDDKWAETNANIVAVTNLLKGELARTVEFDADPELMNFKGTVLRLTLDPAQPVVVEGPLRPEHFISQTTEAEYIPDARSAVWDKAVSEIFPAPEVRAFVQMTMGLSLYGRVRDHVLPTLVGPRRNGKTRVVEAFGYALGSYAMKFPSSLLEAGTREHPTELMDLQKCRYGYISETEDGKRWNANRGKALSGGDRIKARGMYKDYVEWAPSHTLWTATNNRPSLIAADPAFWDRYREIPCVNRWYHPNDPLDSREGALGPADLDLPAALERDASALLRWALEGWAMYVRNGGALSYPAQVVAATADARANATTFGVFVRECLVRDPKGEINIEEIFQVWEVYLKRESLLNVEWPRRSRDIAGELTKELPYAEYVKRLNGHTPAKITGISWSDAGRALLEMTDRTAVKRPFPTNTWPFAASGVN